MPMPGDALRHLNSFSAEEFPFANWNASRINRAMKKACRKLNLDARATSYTFRYNYMAQIMDLPVEERQLYTMHMDPNMINAYKRFHTGGS